MCGNADASRRSNYRPVWWLAAPSHPKLTPTPPPPDPDSSGRARSLMTVTFGWHRSYRAGWCRHATAGVRPQAASTQPPTAGGGGSGSAAHTRAPRSPTPTAGRRLDLRPTARYHRHHTALDTIYSSRLTATFR
ncbi:hypothetical protein CBL_05755 [Carabus blaptoides fortunei]